MSTESERLKEDIQRMLAGNPPREQQEPEEDDNTDFDESVSEAKGEIAEVVRDVIRQTITRESIKKICEEKGLITKLGQVGVSRIAEELKSELTYAMENSFPEDR